ncbi:MAG TPA: PLP-dependent transferase, partial [Thermoplasmata archaeon]
GFGDAGQAQLAARQMSGRGGIVAVTLRGGRPAAEQLLRSLRLVHVAASLGGVESLASRPSETSHLRLSPEERAERGIEEGLVRFSFGIEEPDDLVRDVTEALDALSA